MIATSQFTISVVNDGQTGSQGVSVVSTYPEWRLSDASNNLIPPDDQVSGSGTPYHWSTTKPSVPAGKYIWERTVTVLSNNTTVESNPVCDIVMSGVIFDVDANTQAITNKVWSSDISTAINTYDGSTAQSIRNRLSDVETDLDGIYTQVLDIYTSADPVTGDITYESQRMSSLEQEADKIALMVSVDGTTSSLTLTNGMLSAMTSQFVVKDPAGSATVISGGRIQANSITTAMLDTDAIKSTNYDSGTTNQLVPSYDSTTNPYHFSTSGTYLDLANGNLYSPNFSVINTVPTGSSVSTGVYVSGHIEATSGTIGGCSISNGVLQISDANISGTISSNHINASGLTIGASQINGVYGTCPTAANTGTKVVTCSGYNLKEGATITVYFYNENTATSNVYLNINRTGAKKVLVGTSENSSTYQVLWGSPKYITFCYTSNSYRIVDTPGAYYGACSTAESTVAKTVSVSNFLLFKGVTVNIKMTYANTAASPTLNVSGTGAKSIYTYGSNTFDSDYNWEADSTISVVFDGQYWRLADTSTTMKALTAATTATNYMTDISNDGVFVHESSGSAITPSTTGANGVHISDDVDIIRNGTVVATYGSSVILGEIANGVTRVQIDNDSLDVISRDSNGVDATVATFGQKTIIGESDSARTEIDSEQIEWYIDENTLVGGIYYGSDAIAISVNKEVDIDINTNGAEVIPVSNGASILTFPEIHLTCSLDYADANYDNSTGHIDVNKTFSIDPTTLMYEDDGSAEPSYKCLYTKFILPVQMSNGDVADFVITVVTDISYNIMEVNIGGRFYLHGPFLWAADEEWYITGSSSLIYYQRDGGTGQAVSFGNTNQSDIISNAVNSHFPIRLGSFIRSDILDSYALMVGKGTDAYHRNTALTIDWDGNINTTGSLTVASKTIYSSTGNCAISHIGMIIMSTTLSTMNDVIAVYGGTTWIQHSGYMLMGASSGVTSGDQHNVSDGGAATHNHGAKTGSVTLSAAQSGLREHGHGVYYKRANITANNSGNTHILCHSSNTGATNWAASNANAAGAVQKASSANATSGHDHSISSASNMPPYKNVYIWERTA